MKRYYAMIAFVLLSCSREKKPVSVYEAGQTSKSDVMMLTNNQIILANITTATTTMEAMTLSTPVNARIIENEDTKLLITARVEGRIERLYVRESGRSVRMGEPLYDLYSESLIALQQEFVIAADQFNTLGKEEPRFKSFYDASRRKLRLYGLTDKQIDQLEAKRQTSERLTIFSTASGIVTDIPVFEGQYVAEGTPLFAIADLRSVWVEAELYGAEATGVGTGAQVEVQADGIPGTLKATVFFRSPEFRNNTQIIMLRALIDNKAGELLPGMEAQLLLGKNRKQAIALPTSAIIRGGKDNVVFVQTAQNTFEPRKVSTGLEGFDQIEITDGIGVGDTVVVTGAYLLHSEYVLKRGMMEHAH